MCQAARIRRLRRQRGSGLSSGCRDCRLSLMNPQYTDRYLAEFYASYTSMSPPEDLPRPGRRGGLCKRSDFEMIHQHAETGRFLGVGVGDVVSQVENRRRNTAGRSKATTWMSHGHLRHRGRQKSARRSTAAVCFDLDLPPEPSTICIYMDQVLEHRRTHKITCENRSASARARWRAVHRLPKHRLAGQPGENPGRQAGPQERAFRGRHYDMRHYLFYYSPGASARILERHFASKPARRRGSAAGRARTCNVAQSHLGGTGCQMMCAAASPLESTFRSCEKAGEASTASRGVRRGDLRFQI